MKLRLAETKQGIKTEFKERELIEVEAEAIAKTTGKVVEIVEFSPEQRERLSELEETW